MTIPLLNNVRILELALLMPADHVGAALADLGAEVIKIEQPPKGDYVRELGGVLAPGISEFHLFYNRNKKSLSLNLKTQEGQKIFAGLVATADVVYVSGVPETWKKLECDYDSCRQIKPDIIYVAYTGFGMDSAYSHIPAHGFGVSALSGLRPPERLPDGKIRPTPSRAGVIGPHGPMICSLVVAAALYHRARTGTGCFVDMAMADCDIYLQHSDAFTALNHYPVQIPQMVPGRSEPVRFTYYQCKDGRSICFQAVELKFWNRFCCAVGREDWKNRGDWKIGVDYGTDDPGLESEMRALFETKTLQEWMVLLGDADVPVVPAMSLEQVVDDQYVLNREMISQYEHPGFGPVRQVAFPARVPGASFKTIRPAPCVGEHNEEILLTLGYTLDRVPELKKKGVI